MRPQQVLYVVDAVGSVSRAPECGSERFSFVFPSFSLLLFRLLFPSPSRTSFIRLFPYNPSSMHRSFWTREG